MNTKINCLISDPILLPKYATNGASGMDLMAKSISTPLMLRDKVEVELGGDVIFNLQPGNRVLVKTGLSIELPENYEAQVRPRSGLAIKNGISVVNTPGTVDDDYRGEIGVILINHGNEPFPIRYGDRIAQMVFMKVEKFDFTPVTELDTTTRGSGGYGSTGK